MTPRITVDVSKYQKGVDDSYTRDWFSFRACDGDYVDPLERHNLAWSIKARREGRLRNFEVYVVWRPGRNATILRILRELGVPTDCVVKVDTESWGGKIRGNRSTEINSLLTSLRARQSGRSELVVEYANRGDFSRIHPSRLWWVGLWIAAYTSIKPSNVGPGPLAGWQYTDGEAKYPVPAGWPRSSRPFGRCDHNVVYSAPLPNVAVVKPKPKPIPVKPVPVIQEVTDMFIFYIALPKSASGVRFAAWERGPGYYRPIRSVNTLHPLIRGGAKAVYPTAAEHAATLAELRSAA